MRVFYFLLLLLLTPALFAQSSKGFDGDLFDKVYKQVQDEMDEDDFVKEYPDAKKHVWEEKDINIYTTGNLKYSFHDGELFWVSFIYSTDEWKNNGGINALDKLMKEKLDGESIDEWEYHSYNWGNYEHLVVTNAKPDDGGEYWFAVMWPVNWLEYVFVD